MSYLLIAAILLMFLFLWSRLPEPPERRHTTFDRTSSRQNPDTQGASTGERRGVTLHPDQLGEADEHGRIRIGVSNWCGPDPTVPGYVRCRIDLDHVARPPRVVTYEPQQIVQLAPRQPVGAPTDPQEHASAAKSTVGHGSAGAEIHQKAPRPRPRRAAARRGSLAAPRATTV